MTREPSLDYTKDRPVKTIFKAKKQKTILKEVRKFIYNNLPKNTKLHKKRLFGSLAKGSFGKYEKKWKNREYSDVDVLFVVDDTFIPPSSWKVHFTAEEKVWVVYNVAIIKVKNNDEIIPIDLQYIVLTKTFANEPTNIARAESWGIPLKKFFSKNKYISL